jgi:branched-chain amino acid transport system permease protein
MIRAVILAVALLAVPLLPGYVVSLAIQMLIFAVLAVSVDIMAGFAGRTPLGHGAIFGVSTYVVVWWVTAMSGSVAIAILLGVLAATALALLMGLLASRVSGVYFLLLTLALGMIVWGVCLRWTSVTGGENGLRGSVRPALLAGDTALYYVVLAATLVLAWLAWRLVRSPFGLALRGLRDSEGRMRALGYNVTLHLVLAFTASGFLAGCAGALYALFNEFASPSTVALGQSVRGLLMAITGGVGTIAGGFVGSVVIVSLENLVSLYTARWQTVMGLVFIVIMLVAPDGILGRIRQISRPFQGERA